MVWFGQMRPESFQNSRFSLQILTYSRTVCAHAYWTPFPDMHCSLLPWPQDAHVLRRSRSPSFWSHTPVPKHLHSQPLHNRTLFHSVHPAVHVQFMKYYSRFYHVFPSSAFFFFWPSSHFGNWLLFWLTLPHLHLHLHHSSLCFTERDVTKYKTVLFNYFIYSFLLTFEQSAKISHLSQAITPRCQRNPQNNTSIVLAFYFQFTYSF